MPPPAAWFEQLRRRAPAGFVPAPDASDRRKHSQAAGPVGEEVNGNTTIMQAIAALLMLSVSFAAAGEAPALPDHNVTPGDALQFTPEQVCAPGHAKSVRHVAGKVKARVYRAYGVADHDGYIIDHLIAVELGGSNSVRNLWPQRLRTPTKRTGWKITCTRWCAEVQCR